MMQGAAIDWLAIVSNQMARRIKSGVDVDIAVQAEGEVFRLAAERFCGTGFEREANRAAGVINKDAKQEPAWNYVPGKPVVITKCSDCERLIRSDIDIMWDDGGRYYCGKCKETMSP